MIHVLEWFYDAWEYIVIIDTVVGVVSGLISFRPRAKAEGWNEGRNGLVKFLFTTLFFIAIISIIISGLAAMSFTKVPNVVNKTVQDAREMLQEADLKLVLPNNILKNSETDQYTITTQNYEENAFVFKGTDVTVTLDNRNQSYVFVSVPRVVGENYLDAISLLSGQELLYTTTVVGDIASIENALVIGQSIAEGSRVPIGTIIDLKLSFDDTTVDSPVMESDMVKVPDVINMNQEEAEETLKRYGLTAFVWWPSSLDSTLDTYYIINQSIPAGSIVPKGTEVKLERNGVKLGTSVVVPNVVGMEQIEATDYLVNLGLQFQVWWTEENDVSVEHYYIIGQSVPADSTVPAGTLIELELSSKKP